jgi:uncharacterized protein YegL
MSEMFDDVIGEVEEEGEITSKKPQRGSKSGPKSVLTNHVAFILDRSGSMERISKQSMNNFNEQLQTLKKESHDQETLVTLVMFNDKIDTKFIDKPLDEVNELTDYPTSGMTALYDSIGMTVNKLEGSVKKDHAALVVVITDGEENASSDYRGEDGRKAIKQKIERLEKLGNWTFTFLGANIDVERVGVEGMAFSSANTMSFTSDAKGAKLSSRNIVSGISAYYNARRGGETQVKDFYNQSDAKTEDTTNTDNVVTTGVSGEVNYGDQAQGKTSKG